MKKLINVHDEEIMKNYKPIFNQKNPPVLKTKVFAYEDNKKFLE
jgi:hypothetical protein